MTELLEAVDDWSYFFVAAEIDLLSTQHVRVGVTLQDDSIEYSQTDQFFNFSIIYPDLSRSDEVSVDLEDLVEGKEIHLENDRDGPAAGGPAKVSDLHEVC